MGEVTEAWKRIERWLAREAPDAFAALRDGASEAQIAEVERAVGVALPAGLRESLARHDGEDGRFPPGIAENQPFLSCARIVEEWEGWTGLLADGTFDDFEVEPPEDATIKTDQWYRRGWIPFAGQDGFDFCVDVDPGPDGTAGQVVEMDHEAGPREASAPSFETWMRRLADAYDAGAVEVTEEGDLDLDPDRR